MGKWIFLFVYGMLVIKIVRTVIIYLNEGQVDYLFLFFGFAMFCYGHYIKLYVMSVTELYFIRIYITRTSKCWEKLTWNVTLYWVETSFSYIPFFPRGINCYKYSKCQFLIQSCITILIFFFLFFSHTRKIRLKWSPSFFLLSLATVGTVHWPQSCSTLFISCN